MIGALNDSRRDNLTGAMRWGHLLLAGEERRK